MLIGVPEEICPAERRADSESKMKIRSRWELRVSLCDR